MYISKIPGTKFVCSLESVRGQWMVRLKLGEVVEAEVPVIKMEKKALRNQIGELFRMVNLNINSFQIDIIHKEIISQISHMLNQKPAANDDSTEAPSDEIKREDPRVDELLKKMEKLEEIIDGLNHRIERIEAMNPE